MSRFTTIVASVLAIAALNLPIGLSPLHPAPVLAVSATVSVDATLLDAPSPDAVPLATLPWGAAVSIDGDPIDGYYPVSSDGIAGWLPAEVLTISEEPPPETTDAAAAPIDPAAPPPGQAVPVAENLDSAPAAPDPAAAEPATEPASDPAAAASTSSYPDAGPTGPADVIAEADIRAGPGPEFGLIATAPVGSTVEQTGHQIDGYVTVQFAEITGWAPLEKLGPPGSAAEISPAESTTNQGEDAAPRSNEERNKGDKGGKRNDKRR